MEAAALAAWNHTKFSFRAHPNFEAREKISDEAIALARFPSRVDEERAVVRALEKLQDGDLRVLVDQMINLKDCRALPVGMKPILGDCYDIDLARGNEEIAGTTKPEIEMNLKGREDLELGFGVNLKRDC
ncbi:hypothetical protein SBOR_3488 [Sclerotinia borealis F-4128]|uniref:Uncharacterized protein n=1 Tax=Sclerotinia borealis (strain F-4128) TaxID=1432307 RepID=W9CN69_SCLBF|nr:hypothetical protein SBOR_3488 [Sclerotinia borealis F-4128]